MEMELKMKWDGLLIAISYLVSVQAAYTAILILQMRFARWLLAIAALCLSVSGIWSMHFIGMAAMTIDTHVEYNIGWTIGSVFFAFVSTFLGFLLLDMKMGTQADAHDISIDAHIEAVKAAPHPYIGLSATLIALGVCAMHYTGMHAMEPENTTMTIDWGIVIGSCFIALFAATAALYFAFVLPITRRFTIPTALVAGVAVCGMHYTGMYGIRYNITDVALMKPGTSSIEEVALYIVFASSAISSGSLAFSSFMYRANLRTAATHAQEFADNIIAGRFDELEGDDACAAEHAEGETDRSDPIMRQISESYRAMGTQLKMLKTFMPASLLAQFEAANNPDNTDDEGSVQVDSQSLRSASYVSSTYSQEAMGNSSTKLDGSESAVSASSDGRGSHREQQRQRKAAMKSSMKSVVSRNVAVVAVNILGFHAVFSQKYLDSYSRVVEQIVSAAKHNKGLVDIMHGDHFLLSFNAGLLNANFSRAGITTALAVTKHLRELGMCVSSGVAVGSAFLGNIGSKEMMRYSVCGPVVTNATSLERYCRKLHATQGTHILALTSPEMHFAAELRALDVVAPEACAKGLFPVIFEGVGEHKTNADEWMYELESQAKHNVWRVINAAFDEYSRGRPDEALEILADEEREQPAAVAEPGKNADAEENKPAATTDGCVNTVAKDEKLRMSVARLRELCEMYPEVPQRF